MKNSLKISVLVGAFAMLVAPKLTHQAAPKSAKERFALDVKACQEATASGKPGKCSLFGKIKFVTSFPDVKVQVVTSFPDIQVQMVQSFPDKPGKWQEVSSFPDYKVQIVQSFPDYKIKYVNSFPGCN